MSGIEVAGLILGVIPVLISGLEQWRKSAEVFGDWDKIKREYRKCKQDLICAELQLEVNLERFLLPLLVDDGEIALLMQEPGGSRWQNPELEKTLKERLPKSYEVFVEYIHEINDVLQRIRVEIGMDNFDFQDIVINNPVLGKMKILKLWHEGSKEQPKGIGKHISAQAQRAKFAFRRADRTKLFDELTRYNDWLKGLLDCNEISQRLKKARGAQPSKVTEGIFSLWHHAERVHELLLKAFRCKCRSLHRLHLRLFHLTHCKRVEFYLLVSGLVDATPSDWKALIARKLDPKLTTQVAQSLPIKAKESIKPAICTGSKAETGLITSAETLRLQVSISSPDMTYSEQKEGDVLPIDDICKAIASNNHDLPSNCIGKLEDSEDAFLLLSSVAPSTSLSKDSPSLATILHRKSATRLSRKQRYSVALVLASSHVQLFSSSWVTAWRKERILFSCDSFNEPCLVHHLDNEDVPPTSPPSRSKAIQSLGILLVELCYGECIEDQDLRKQLQPGAMSNPELEATFDLVVAQEWARGIAGEAGEKYADAVNWCLLGGKEDDKIWRKSIWINVVEPLQWSLEQFG